MSVALGNYKVEESLGSGGMGEVFKAYDPKLKRYVAVKLIHRLLCRQRRALRRFEREVQASIALSHPNIVKIFDFHRGQQTVYYVMEFLDGLDLARRIEAEETFPLTKVFSIMDQLLDALAYVHGEGMLHRDIKPQNIMVSDDGTLRLMDFGLVKLEERSSTTQAGKIMGTVRYTAPEVLRGAKADERSDIYQAGLIAFALITGTFPFSHCKTGRGLLDALRGGLMLFPDTDSARGAPPSVRAWIEKACTEDPANRFQSAGDAARELRRIGICELSSDSVARLVPLGHYASTPPPRRRPPWHFAAFAAIIAVLLLAFVLFRSRPYAPSHWSGEVSAATTKMGAVITWESGPAYAGCVEVRDHVGKLVSRVVESRRRLSHRIEVQNLQPAARYSYRLVFPDGGHLPDRSFRTTDGRKLEGVGHE